MTWGVGFFYYRCPRCGRKFKYAEDLMIYFEDSFGHCPDCGVPGIYVKDGPRGKDDNEYYEVEE
ncbi:MAG: excinuclease ATPase subunit [Clostridia bacterium]|nr:excinuclease ATPase subunit [Clostridia bacterium]